MTTEELNLENSKMRAEIAYLTAQTMRINQQMKWQMPLYMVSFLGAIIAAVNIFQ